MINTTKKINNLIQEIENKKEVGWAEARTYPNEIKNKLEVIATESQQEIDEINKKAEQLQKENDELKIRFTNLLHKLEVPKTDSEETKKLKKTFGELQGQISEKDKELEEAQKRLTEALTRNDQNNEVVKKLMTEYLESIRGELKAFQDLGENKVDNEEERKEFKKEQEALAAKIEQVQQIIEKLNIASNQQLVAQIEIKK